MKQNRYVFLDGIRGIAAVLVLTRHTDDFWHYICFRSYLAVDLFFVLSGFVIAHAYDEKIRTGEITLPKFVLIRLVRLYPVFFLSILLSFIVLIGKLVFNHQVNQVGFPGILDIILLTIVIFPSHLMGNNLLFPTNVTYWSLFFELVTNVIYASIRRFLTKPIMLTILIGSGLLLGYVADLHHNLDVGFKWGYESILSGFIRSVFGIFLGLFLFEKQGMISNYLSDKPYAAWLAVIILTLILASPNAGSFNWIIDMVAVVLVFPICVLCASQGKTTKLQGVLLTLGSASYPIYVLHKPVSELVFFLFRTSVKEYAPLSGVVLTLTLIAISIGVEKFYDIPLRRWISKKLWAQSASRNHDQDSLSSLSLTRPSDGSGKLG